MVERRALLRAGAAAGLGGLAGCSNLPLIGCSPPDEEPPEASFRLEFEEEHADGQIDYAVVNEGPATFDEINTGALVVHVLEGENDVHSINKWFDSEAPEGEPVVESAKPTEPDDRGLVIQRRSEGWRPVEVGWGRTRRISRPTLSVRHPRRLARVPGRGPAVLLRCAERCHRGTGPRTGR